MVTATLFVLPQAFASKARMTALGQDSDGSFYVDDARNIFLNPAKLNSFTNSVNLEWGTTARGATGFAEGGFARDFGGYNLAVQLGRQSNAESSINNIINGLAPFNANAASNFMVPNNTAEVIGAFKSGGMDVGISVLFGFSEDKAAENAFPNKEAGTLQLRGGVAQDKWNAFAYFDVIHNSKNETAASTENEYEQDVVAGLGGEYMVGKNSKAFLDFDYGAVKAKDATPTVDYEVKAMAITLGYAKKHDKDGAMLFYSAGIEYLDGEQKEKEADASQDIKGTSIPLVIGVEGKATDWLMLRGSVSQNILLDNVEGAADDKSSHPANTTVVAAGASFTFGKFQIDGVLGGSGGTGSGALNANTLFVNTSLNYNF